VRRVEAEPVDLAAAGGDAPAPSLACLLAKADDDTWSLQPVLEWLFGPGRQLGEALPLTEGLGRALLAAGAPLWRLRIAIPTLHPQVAAWGFTWMRGGHGSERSILHGYQSTEDYVGSPIQHVHETRRPFRRRLTELERGDHSILHALAANGGTDYLALPLLFSVHRSGALTLATTAPAGFSDADIDKLTALTRLIGPLYEIVAGQRIARALLDTYVGRRTGRKVLEGLVRRGDAEVIRAALWYSDLRDFTALTETLTKALEVATLNAYFEHVAAAVTARGGEILRFIGDAMLIVFPAQSEHAVRLACASALDAALDAFASLAALNHQRLRRREPAIRFGLGLHVGEVIYGNVGAPDRLDFTVMGPAVNRTARIETLTKALEEPLLLSGEFARLCETPTRSLGRHRLGGISEPQEVFALAEPPY